MHICMYMYVCVCVCVCMYTHTYMSRYIISFRTGNKLINHGVEFLELQVEGQSFIQHELVEGQSFMIHEISRSAK